MRHREKQEKWEMLEPSDPVFHIHSLGKVVAYKDDTSRKMYGARVQLRNGRYMKRTWPLEDINGGLINDLRRKKDYELGRDLIHRTRRA